jgi:nanoRNase/pAp phosphatase (c-di-AMP/oligoRNAs hydrolase)
MDQKQAIADRLRQANNILVTVSTNPTVDQLASCIGLTLGLNKMGKHAIAVFSGAIPETIQFLQPESTFEKNTDSLRDFIIALDKAKADKLRYKVEDKIVKIFITPYKTSLTDQDLEFSQGEFNVDVVLAIGVHTQADMDQAITAHGRILHDATVVTINTQPGGELGSMNWLDPKASSLSELVVSLLGILGKQLMDGQIATALLTGIVAETARFSNSKTTSLAMSMSAELMAAGANQQLVVSKLQSAAPAAIVDGPTDKAEAVEVTHGGTLEITHTDEPSTAVAAPQPALQAQAQAQAAPSEPSPAESTPTESIPPPVMSTDALLNQPAGESEDDATKTPQINIDDRGMLHNLAYEQAPDAQAAPVDRGPASTDPNDRLQSQRMILQPPSMGGQTAPGAMMDDASSMLDPLTGPLPAPTPLLQRSSPPAAPAATASDFSPPTSTPVAPVNNGIASSFGQPAPSFGPSPLSPPVAPPVFPAYQSAPPQPMVAPVPDAPAAVPPPAPVFMNPAPSAPTGPAPASMPPPMDAQLYGPPPQPSAMPPPASAAPPSVPPPMMPPTLA